MGSTSPNRSGRFDSFLHPAFHNSTLPLLAAGSFFSGVYVSLQAVGFREALPVALEKNRPRTHALDNLSHAFQRYRAAVVVQFEIFMI
jgi:hypothetical protein